MSSGLTSTYLLPYPIQTDFVNVAEDIEDLSVAVESQLLLKSPTLSPPFTGTPTAPTAASDTSTTQIATTEFVINQGYLKNSLALSTYAPLASPALTGNPTTTTQTLGNSSTRIATTAFVANALSSFVTLPNQASNFGKFLSTNGTDASWLTIQQSDVQNLSSTLASLSSIYSPLSIATVTSSGSKNLILTDAAKIIEMSNGGTLTVPTSSVAFPNGTQIVILQTSSSQVTLAGASGVTVNGTPGLKLRSQWSSATLIKRSDTLWVALGDLSA